MQHICIITDLHISTNPRVWKEAIILNKGGYQVSVVTVFNSAFYYEKDKDLIKRLGLNIKYIAAVNTIPGQVSVFKKYMYKARKAYAMTLKKAGVESIYLFGKDPNALCRAALEENADLYIAHVDCSLLVGKALIELGKKVAFDIEDWYSQDYITARKPLKKLISLEKFALKRGVYVTCPSLAMSKALLQKYDVSRKVEVVYNIFPHPSGTEKIKNVKNDIPVFIWFSQTVGPGRGLEKIIRAMHELSTPSKLLLVGNCSIAYKQQLTELFPYDKGHQLELIPFVTHEELNQLLRTCDIGLALENNYPANKDTTISNKILQYLQFGMKVLATATKGQIEVAEHFPGAVEVVAVEDVSSWESAIEKLLHTKTNKKEIIEKYNTVFSWEEQERKILKLVKNALAS